MKKGKLSIEALKKETKNVINVEGLVQLKGGIDEWGCYEKLPHDDIKLELIDEVDES